MSVVEREGAAYGGYGGVYVHDYRGPMIQTEQSLLQDHRRSSKGSITESGRLSRQGDQEFIPTSMYPVSGGYVVTSGTGMASPIQFDSRSDINAYHVDFRSSDFTTELPRRSSLKKTNEKYNQPPRTIYTPLNNESRLDKSTISHARKPPDLTIVNNTIAPGSQMTYKNVNTHANLKATSSLIESSPQHSVLRRGSEPPRPFARSSANLRNRSFDDLGGHIQPETDIDAVQNPLASRDNRCPNWRGSRREEDRESTRTISRAHLRRDSFGEVVSRRSPSQDSIEMSRTRSSPEAEEEGYRQSHPDTAGETEDIWSFTPSSRLSPSQDSLHRQVSTRVLKLS